jgi:uncharacterized membrane protein
MMYYYDPERGRRRRALLRDQFMHACSKTVKAADVARRDAGNRLYGTVAELRSALRRESVSDDVLVSRVRSKIGRFVSHPSSIEVTARDGRVTLRGPILTKEAERLVSAVRGVNGVAEVETDLTMHDERGNVAALQGGSPRTGEPVDVMQAYWAPTTRLAVGAAGTALMANCLARRTPAAIALGTVGFGLAARALTNLPVDRLLGLGQSRRGIDVPAAIVIHAPVDELFSLLSDPANYPRLSDCIAEVRHMGNGRYQKVASLPGVPPLVLEETITIAKPNEMIVCRSEPESAIKYAGTAWFTPLNDWTTRVQVCLTYKPPGGIFSHAAATLFGMSPKQQLDDFLLRAKTFLETGRRPRDAAGQTPLQGPSSAEPTTAPPMQVEF